MINAHIAMLILATSEINNEVFQAIALVGGGNFTIDITFSLRNVA